MVVRGEQKDLLGVSSGGGGGGATKGDDGGGVGGGGGGGAWGWGRLCSLTPVRNLSHTTGLIIGPNRLVKQEDTDAFGSVCLHVCTSTNFKKQTEVLPRFSFLSAVNKLNKLIWWKLHILVKGKGLCRWLQKPVLTWRFLMKDLTKPCSLEDCDTNYIWKKEITKTQFIIIPKVLLSFNEGNAQCIYVAAVPAATTLTWNLHCCLYSFSSAPASTCKLHCMSMFCLGPSYYHHIPFPAEQSFLVGSDEVRALEPNINPVHNLCLHNSTSYGWLTSSTSADPPLDFHALLVCIQYL